MIWKAFDTIVLQATREFVLHTANKFQACMQVFLSLSCHRRQCPTCMPARQCLCTAPITTPTFLYLCPTFALDLPVSISFPHPTDQTIKHQTHRIHILEPESLLDLSSLAD